MKIALATALYPPDIAEPAPYIKELAQRLTKDNDVTVVHYGHLPEQVPHVTYVSVSKRQPLFRRLITCCRKLHSTAKRADILYVENGPSIELPALFVSFTTRTPLIFHRGDHNARTKATKHLLYGMLEKIVLYRATYVLNDMLPPRPEILPFAPYPKEAFETYERSWNNHIALLTKIFSSAGDV